MNKHRTTAAWGCLVSLIFSASMLLFAAQKAESAAAGTRKNMKSKPSAVLKEPTAPVTEASPLDKMKAHLPGRDPFRTLAVHKAKEETAAPVLPGKAGLRIGKLEIRGIVQSGKAAWAVVESPPSVGALFLKVNDELFDGRVLSINKNSVTFEERTVDPNGNPLTRSIQKRIAGTGGVKQ
jgi:Tfp pilus assembly protein PilP